MRIKGINSEVRYASVDWRKSDKQIAKELGIGPASVDRYRRRHDKPKSQASALPYLGAEERICPHCGMLFLGKGNKIYCSDKCREKDYTAPKRNNRSEARLNIADRDRYQELATQQGVSLSAWVRNACEKAAKEQEAQ